MRARYVTALAACAIMLLACMPSAGEISGSPESASACDSAAARSYIASVAVEYDEVADAIGDLSALSLAGGRNPALLLDSSWLEDYDWQLERLDSNARMLYALDAPASISEVEEGVGRAAAQIETTAYLIRQGINELDAEALESGADSLTKSSQAMLRSADIKERVCADSRG